MPTPNQTDLVLRVLVVDDCVDTVESLAELLTLHGHTVRVALDGASALHWAEAEQPDVVLLDLYMPRLSGCEVARIIRERCGATEKRPLLVALTGCEASDARLRSSGARFDLHLVKPVEPAVLIGVLERFRRVFTSPQPETESEPCSEENHPARASGREPAGIGSRRSRFAVACNWLS